MATTSQSAVEMCFQSVDNGRHRFQARPMEPAWMKHSSSCSISLNACSESPRHKTACKAERSAVAKSVASWPWESFMLPDKPTACDTPAVAVCLPPHLLPLALYLRPRSATGLASAKCCPVRIRTWTDGLLQCRPRAIRERRRSRESCACGRGRRVCGREFHSAGRWGRP